MGKSSQTQSEGFDDFLGGFADESIFRLGLLGSVLDFEVHLPAYIIGKINKRSSLLGQIIKAELRSRFVD
jgi:hypothetical protein